MNTLPEPERGSLASPRGERAAPRGTPSLARSHRPRPLDVIHVGSACRDITGDDPRGWRLGGGVTYAALATARLGLRTGAVMGVDREARTAHELGLLREAGVDLMLVELDEGPVFNNVEQPTGRVQTCIAPGRVLPVPLLPESWLAARAWSIAPVAGEVTDSWAPLITGPAYVAVGWQGFLRELVAGERVRRRGPLPSRLLSRANLVGVSHHDLDPETPLHDLYPLLGPGAVLLVTRGSQGGVLVTLDTDRRPARRLRYLAVPADDEVDATGAGDTFLAALLSTALRGPLSRRSRGRLDLPFATAAGSLVVEGPGLSAVPNRAAVLVRMARERVRQLVVPSITDRVGSDEADGTSSIPVG
jgi:sugar/nucleoside kinase (ribokinase family)